jgi:hypothetical protein
LSGIGKGNLKSGTGQFTRGWPFASDGFPAGLTHTNDYWRARIKIAHHPLPIIS